MRLVCILAYETGVLHTPVSLIMLVASQFRSNLERAS
jgi:hypothetical protein